MAIQLRDALGALVFVDKECAVDNFLDLSKMYWKLSFVGKNGVSHRILLNDQSNGEPMFVDQPLQTDGLIFTYESFNSRQELHDFVMRECV